MRNWFEKTVRGFIALPLVAALAACASGPPPAALSPEQAAEISIVETSVDLSSVGPTTSGREVGIDVVERAFDERQDFLLSGDGGRDARAELVVQNVNIITAGQSLFLGGESIMIGTVSLVDVADGAQIVAPVRIESGGGGYVLGGVIGALTLEDGDKEVQILTDRFLANAQAALVGSGSAAQ
ncbi:MAG: hypothetical protein AAGE80_20060 [Pseudomonadota bacterium]